jgi:hypothetical protein
LCVVVSGLDLQHIAWGGLHVTCHSSSSRGTQCLQLLSPERLSWTRALATLPTTNVCSGTWVVTGEPVSSTPGRRPTPSPTRGPGLTWRQLTTRHWSATWGRKIRGTVTGDTDGWVAYLRIEDPPGLSPISTVGRFETVEAAQVAPTTYGCLGDSPRRMTRRRFGYATHSTVPRWGGPGDRLSRRGCRQPPSRRPAREV